MVDTPQTPAAKAVLRFEISEQHSVQDSPRQKDTTAS